MGGLLGYLKAAEGVFPGFLASAENAFRFRAKSGRPSCLCTGYRDRVRGLRFFLLLPLLPESVGERQSEFRGYIRIL